MSIKAVATCTLACLLGACSTVKSERKTNEHPVGMTYFLPMRMMKLTVTPAVPEIKKLLESHDEAAAAVVEAKAGKKVADAALAKAEALLLQADDKTRDDLTAARDMAAVEAKAMAQAHSDAVGALAVADKRIELAKAPGKCTFDAKLELLPAQADTRQRFVAHLAHNPMRDDEMTLKVSGSGLLTSAKAIATDQTSEIISQFAGAMASGGMGGTKSTSRSVERMETVACDQGLVLIFDPVGDLPTASERSNPRRKTAADLEFEQMRKWETDCEYKRRLSPLRASAALAQANATLCPFGLKLAIGEFERGAEGLPDSPKAGAIYYRAPMPVVITVMRGQDPIDAAIVNLPQAGPTSYIPMKSSVFVKTVDDVEFTDGSVTSWNTNRPSEVLEVVRLPVKVLTSIISVPASLISLRVDYSSKANALAENQAKEIQSAEALARIQQCVAAAQNAGTSTDACF